MTLFDRVDNEKFADVTIIGEAGDGNVAIEMALTFVPHVIIMDVEMPRLGGIEATRQIKRVLPDLHIIGLSSHGDSMTRDAMAEAGCSAFVTKECVDTLPVIIAHIAATQKSFARFRRRGTERSAT